MACTAIRKRVKTNTSSTALQEQRYLQVAGIDVQIRDRQALHPQHRVRIAPPPAWKQQQNVKGTTAEYRIILKNNCVDGELSITTPAGTVRLPVSVADLSLGSLPIVHTRSLVVSS